MWKKCFLGPKKSFPICAKGTCKINKKGLYAAYVRARQWGKKRYSYKGRSRPTMRQSTYKSVARKAKSMLKRRGALRAARNANLVPVNAKEVAVADANQDLVNAKEVANADANQDLVNAKEVANADANLVPVNAKEVAVADAVNYKKYK